MNQHLEHIWDTLRGNDHLSEEQKYILFESIKKVDKEIEIISFKLDRTEKVKRTTATLLEETIEELEQKRKVVEETNAALKKSMDGLKAAQAQLIHAEKMASLGELTAGIAHEIQNPLNFVNNFSEVSVDLVDEMKEELAVGSWQSAGEIAEDIKQNLYKVVYHGKRASGIVKGMLEHSRAGSGEKIPTDLNAVADEYLRLAYHGLRAKDKSFSADFRLEADPDLPKVNVVPQDIGRVLLNLINNALYAVSEKAKQNIPGYKPQVIVTTHRQSTTDPPEAEQSTVRKPSSGDLWVTGDMGVIQIRIQDNGPGIPDEIKDKIFQPFFSTKPTGEGTGLGLSLSYDIITKGHGGSLSLETTNGPGVTFLIQIPVH